MSDVATDPMLPDPQVTALVKELEAEGFTSEHLDEAVQNAASERASAVNNGGLYDQVRYLLRGGDHSFKPHEIRFAAQQAKEENDALVDAEEVGVVSSGEAGAEPSPLEQWKARLEVACMPSVFEEAVRRAGEPCNIIQTDETGEALWAVVIEGGFWMDAMYTRDAAESFVQAVGWPLKSVIPDPHVDLREEGRHF